MRRTPGRILKQVLRGARDEARRALDAWSPPTSDGPYPITITRSNQLMDSSVRTEGTETFDTEAARALNDARMRHLATLGLPIESRSVMDVGCGVGHLAQFFVERGCDVLCLDGRPDNVARLGELYPGTRAQVFDVENDDWSSLPEVDVVFSYGLLYHLEDPFRALRRMAGRAKQMLILDTIVADHAAPLVLMAEETATASQALRGVGCRPTPSFVALALREAGMSHVYAPTTMAAHPDFRFSWRNDLAWSRNGHLLRCMFVASRAPLAGPALAELLPP